MRRAGDGVQDDRHVVELEVLEGLRPFVEEEVAERLPRHEVLDGDATALRILLCVEELAATGALRCVVAAHLVVTLDVARPRTIRSAEHLERVVASVAEVRRLHMRRAFASFRISAAGAQSDDFNALADDIARALGLPRDDEDGDLLLRFRRSRVATEGWDVLVRLSPRPLSARAWRTFAFPGSLNATVAAAMVRASQPNATDRFLDPLAGSGTLVVERIAVGPAEAVVAADIDAGAVAGIDVNLRAARLRRRVARLVADGASLPFRADSFDVVCTNLPWGTSVGSHEANHLLYPAVLDDLRRVVTDRGRAVVLTHEIAVFEDALEGSPWSLVACHRVFQKGHHPRMYVLTPA